MSGTVAQLECLYAGTSEGHHTRKMVPSPSVELTCTSPPSWLTSCCTTERPMPLPAGRVAKKGSKSPLDVLLRDALAGVDDLEGHARLPTVRALLRRGRPTYFPMPSL